jgi:hypothetical protein
VLRTALGAVKAQLRCWRIWARLEGSLEGKRRQSVAFGGVSKEEAKGRGCRKGLHRENKGCCISQ